jgi:ribonuclease BN (tRNA processing enzyme)
VKTLVLSHLVPAQDDRLTDQMWIDLARAHFQGQIIVAKDLMEI